MSVNKNVYKSGARHIIFKVFQESMAEFQAGKLLSGLDDVYGRTAKLTGTYMYFNSKHSNGTVIS